MKRISFITLSAGFLALAGMPIKSLAEPEYIPVDRKTLQALINVSRIAVWEMSPKTHFYDGPGKFGISKLAELSYGLNTSDMNIITPGSRITVDSLNAYVRPGNVLIKVYYRRNEMETGKHILIIDKKHQFLLYKKEY